MSPSKKKKTKKKLSAKSRKKVKAAKKAISKKAKAKASKSKKTKSKPKVKAKVKSRVNSQVSSKTKKKTSKKKSAPIAFVSDPFEMPTLDVVDAQNQSGELDLNEPTEGEINLDRLQEAITESEKEFVEEAEARLDSEQSLEEQIAEDKALEEENAKLLEEAEKEADSALPKMDEDGNLDSLELQSCIEALLFISDKPLSEKKLKTLIGPDFPAKEFKKALKELQERYQGTHHGFELVNSGGGYQLRTKAGRAPLARKLAKVQPQKLSRGAMESLAIVAYKQPVMKEEIDNIRGVDSSYFIRGLLEKKLIKMSGRSELPGRPILYSTTNEFLEIFGIPSINELPPLQELEQMIPTSETEVPEDEEDPNIKKMRELVAQMKEREGVTDYDPREDQRFLEEIRERVKEIAISTEYLDDQKEKEKFAKKMAKLAPFMANSEELLPILSGGEPEAEAEAEATPPEGSESEGGEETVIAAEELETESEPMKTAEAETDAEDKSENDGETLDVPPEVLSEDNEMTSSDSSQTD